MEVSGELHVPAALSPLNIDSVYTDFFLFLYIYPIMFADLYEDFSFCSALSIWLCHAVAPYRIVRIASQFLIFPAACRKDTRR
jgi:hypothetical protein